MYMHFGGVGFDWDEGNLQKVAERMHPAIAELAFRGSPYVADDPLHSMEEKRWMLINQVEDRHVFVIFTKRKERIRIITARFMHSKEVKGYEKEFSKESGN